MARRLGAADASLSVCAGITENTSLVPHFIFTILPRILYTTRMGFDPKIQYRLYRLLIARSSINREKPLDCYEIVALGIARQ